MQLKASKLTPLVGQIRRLFANLATTTSNIESLQQKANTEIQSSPLKNSSIFYVQLQRKALLGLDLISPVANWKSETLPTLLRKPDSQLIKYWWSESPFNQTEKLLLPIYSLKSGDFIGQTIELEHLLFNQPIRRDIVHRVLNWSLMFGKRTTHRTRTPAEVAGSGKKPRPQKGSGRARMGNKRASGHRKGGKIFGHIPKDFTFHLPEKVKIKGLISCLSAKLAEGRIRVVDSEILPEHKTKFLNKAIPELGYKETFLFVTPKTCDRNFLLASRNIDRIKVVKPNSVCVRYLLKFDKVIFTVQSLKEFTELLLSYMFMLEKPKAVTDKRIESILNFNYSKKSPDEIVPVYDPNENWEPNFEILKDYYQGYKLYKNEKLLKENAKIEEQSDSSTLNDK